MIEEVFDLVLGFSKQRRPLNVEASPITDLADPAILSLSLLGPDGAPARAEVEEGAEVSPGQFLANDGGRPVVVCPVKGKVISVGLAPDVRGARVGRAVHLEPDPAGSPAAFSRLDPGGASAEDLMSRIKEAGLVASMRVPRLLADALGPKVETVVVLCADREPVQCSMLQNFRERIEDSCAAAKMLAKAAGAKRALLAVPASVAGEAGKVVGRHDVEVLAIPATYPESLPPLVALRAGGGDSVRVISVETALAALDAVREGKVQDRKTVTVIGPGGGVKGNYRAFLGTRIKDLLSSAGLAPADGDKVLAGGPMRGFAQYSMDAPIDQGIDAVTLIAAEDVIEWENEPCINCGSCVSVCPVRLQPQLLGRYAEFGLFDRTGDLAAESCVECGLCAAACPARRPLVQWIRLAKQELKKIEAAELARQAEKLAEKEKASEQGEPAEASDQG